MLKYKLTVRWSVGLGRVERRGICTALFTLLPPLLPTFFLFFLLSPVFPPLYLAGGSSFQITLSTPYYVHCGTSGDTLPTHVYNNDNWTRVFRLILRQNPPPPHRSRRPYPSYFRVGLFSFSFLFFYRPFRMYFGR